MGKAYKPFDIVISGGGIAGCTLALALRQNTQYKIAVIEPQLPVWDNQHPSFDARVIALADESWKILHELGISLPTLHAAPIENICVTDRKHFGQTVLDANALGLSCFGKVVHLSELGRSLFELLKATDVEYITGSSIDDVLREQDCVNIQTKEHSLTCSLLVLAEGGRSPTRTRLNMTSVTDDYHQAAVIANIKTQLPHNNRAFERFSQHGPIALLPLPESKDNTTGHHMSLVWCVSEEKAPILLDYAEDDFTAHLQQLFGDRLGRFELLNEPAHYPLAINVTKDNISHRAICIANTAQTLHPIAGQGFNLGLRDIRDLCRSLEQQPDLGSYQQVKTYQQLRQSDRDRTIGLTDSLVRIFSNHNIPFTPLRSLSLNCLNLSRTAKATFASFSMGQR